MTFESKSKALMNPTSQFRHARLERGLQESPRSRLFEGRFGRMFRALPPAEFEDDCLVKLANRFIDEIGQSEWPVTPETELDDEENYNLPAGYTYFGQFVDHDLTFDPLSSLVKLNDPNGLTNFRTPALDLDGLYGRGPADQPYLYQENSRKFLLGDRVLEGIRREENHQRTLTWDVPRLNGRAVIGDPRNDENIIVSQLHGLFLRFHNFLADEYPDYSFTDLQRLVRWHYQWLVLYDYLPRIVGRPLVEEILPHLTQGGNVMDHQPNLRFYHFKDNPFIPVEFSGAAYRFGHSLIRPAYRLSALDFHPAKPVKGLQGRKLIFAPNPKEGLNGFQAFESNNGIDWSLFFETDNRRLSSDQLGKSRVQPAYKIDTSLVNPLAFLPEFSIPHSQKPHGPAHTNNLAYRNLKRGVSLQLPSGQAVARMMGMDPIPDERLLLGKANTAGIAPHNKHRSGVVNPCILDIDSRYAGKAPLWFYILAEGVEEWRKRAEPLATAHEKDIQPTFLGPVGGRIVAEVLIGLVLGDQDSFLRMEPNWTPLFGNPEALSALDRFRMGDLLEVLPSL